MEMNWAGTIDEWIFENNEQKRMATKKKKV